MGLDLLWMNIASTLLVGYVLVFIILRRVNGWYYDLKLGRKHYLLPKGDMGWPLVGNIVPFMKAFFYGNPNSFINNIISKHGKSGIYKTHLFGNPSIIVCQPEMCRQVLTDDEHFRLGYPTTVTELARSKPIYDAYSAEHKRFRRIIVSPIVGHKALSVYVERIEESVISSLEDLCSMKYPVQFLKEMKKVTFQVIVGVFLGSENMHVFNNIGGLFAEMFDGLFSLPLNLPGSVFHKALKARKKLTSIIQPVVDERRKMIENGSREGKKDLADILLQIEDGNGKKLENEDIVDLLLGFLAAGHESTATTLTWVVIYLTDHPEILKKAKEEQEEILKKREPSQKHIDIKEIKQMVYLGKVIGETLRLANIAFSTFRKAIADVNINGFLIPKGWTVLVWGRAVHMDSAHYENPLEFNPSRWDDYNGKAGTFIPFGAGSRLCPGMDLAKLEISTFMHHFLLNYKLERVNSKCPITYLPAPKPIDGCLAKVIKIS
ncbi:putative beta-amyrin 11-oxidase [Lupinus albus]|uniref:Putative beta-amyrin 11-oxidase n=1 Tax=Lupinus albus TaxID=3870 RepID=A0A6A4QE49_LUPAL|nr:putative beta-amyrin 11-oxidase [Lupinus albus]